MNKKEVLEIRKQFSPSNCAITRICGCYVDHEKQKKWVSKRAFLSIPEEETFKYFEIFKQSLSGTIGKNLMNMEFPLDQEQDGGTQEFLLKLRDSKLEDDMLIEEFYDKVIDFYEYPENYYIVLIHSVYDVPGRAEDGMEMFDASDTVYEHILCSICPVNLTKGGLGYNSESNSIEERMRDWVVERPAKAFLFPAFNDRNSDIHNILYYSRKPEEIQPAFIEFVLGIEHPMTAEVQKESFQSIVTESLGDACSYEVVKNIHENLADMIEEHKEDIEPYELAKPDVKRLLEQSGVPEERIEVFEEQYEETIGEKNSLLATNIVNTKKFQVETPDVEIKVNPERVDLIETRIIDGRPCIVIAADEYIEVNGVPVRTSFNTPEGGEEKEG